MMKHTPGPWNFSPWAQSDEDIALMAKHGMEPTPMMGNNGERYVSGPNGRVADVIPVIAPKRGKGYRHEDAERDANARLIAAAPYMYDALVHIRDSVHLAGYFRDVAADAIAKATGE